MNQINRKLVGVVLACIAVIVVAVCNAKSDELFYPFLGGAVIAFAILSVTADVMSVRITPSSNLDGDKAALFVWAFGSRYVDVAAQVAAMLYILSIVANRALQPFVWGLVFVLALVVLTVVVLFWAKGRIQFFKPAPPVDDTPEKST